MDEKKFEEYFGSVLGGMIDDEQYSEITKSEAFRRPYFKLCAAARSVYKIISTGNDESRLSTEYAEKKINNFKKELGNFVRVLGFSAKRDELFARLQEQFSQVLEGFDDKISEITTQIDDGELTNKDPEEINADVTVSDNMFRTYDIEKDPADEEKVYMELFPSGKPKATDVIQSEENACFMLAPLAALAESNPSVIEDMIHDNGDGTVTVKFFAQKGKERVPYNVKVDKVISSLDSKSAPWVNLIEKAYAVSGLYESRGSYPDIVQKDEYSSVNQILDGGAPQSFIDCISPSGIDRVKTDVFNEIVDSYSIDSAFEKLKSSLLKASQDKNAIFLHTDYHVVAVTDVREENGEVLVDYYDQLASKSGMPNSISTVSLNKIFEGNLNIDFNPVKNIQICSPETKGKAAEMQAIYVSDIRKKVLERNNAVSYDAFKTKITSEFLKNYGLDKAEGKNEVADLSNSASIWYYATKGNTMDTFFKELYNRYSKDNKTLGNLIDDLKNPENELFSKTKDAFIDAMAADQNSNYLAGDVKNIVLGALGQLPKAINKEPEVKNVNQKAPEEDIKQKNPNPEIREKGINKGTDESINEGINANINEGINADINIEIPDDNFNMNPLHEDNPEINVLGENIAEGIENEEELHDPENINYFERDQAMLSDAVKELEAAKTLTNSTEYKNIINTIKALNSESRPGSLQTLSPEQAHAMKLQRIGELIDQYLDHKSVDGVKPNVRNKLLAVQKLNENISKRLNAMNVESFDMLGGGHYEKKHREYEYSKIYNAIPQPDLKNKAAAPKSNEEYNTIAASLNVNGAHPSADSVKHVDNCMSQIVLRAVLKRKPDAYVEGLKQVQGLFNGKAIEAPDIKKDNVVRSTSI